MTSLCRVPRHHPFTDEERKRIVQIVCDWLRTVTRKTVTKNGSNDVWVDTRGMSFAMIGADCTATVLEFFVVFDFDVNSYSREKRITTAITQLWEGIMDVNLLNEQGVKLYASIADLFKDPPQKGELFLLEKDERMYLHRLEELEDVPQVLLQLPKKQ